MGPGDERASCPGELQDPGEHGRGDGLSPQYRVQAGGIPAARLLPGRHGAVQEERETPDSNFLI